MLPEFGEDSLTGGHQTDEIRLTSPQKMPSRMVAGIRSTCHAESRVKWKSESLPTRIYVKQVAVTQAMRLNSL
jgi:hypothetical protein